MIQLSIIILSYNTRDLLRRCLVSIYKKISSATFEVIVVDNASKDESADMINKDFPKVRVIKNKENFGFSKGNNIGASKAKGSNLFFINSDTELLRDNISEAIDYLKKDKTVGAIGGSLLNKNGSLQRSFANFYNLINITLMLFGGDRAELLNGRSDSIKDVDWVSGGFMLIKKDAFNKVVGFDENLFMYIEDMELCYRLKKYGYRVIYYPYLKAIHLGQGSSNREFAILHIYKGLLYYYRKHKSSFEYIILKSLLITKASISLLVGIITRNSYLISTYKKALAY